MYLESGVGMHLIYKGLLKFNVPLWFEFAIFDVPSFIPKEEHVEKIFYRFPFQAFWKGKN